jgi:hypothetical protein
MRSKYRPDPIDWESDGVRHMLETMRTKEVAAALGRTIQAVNRQRRIYKIKGPPRRRSKQGGE